MSNHASEADYAQLALAVYVEELATDKRVLFVGDPESLAPERLARAARSVEVISPAGARGTRRGGRVSTRRWPSAEDEGRWDLIVVPDLPRAGFDDDDKMEELASWLSEDGVLVASSPDPDGPASNETALGYEELFELLGGSFDAVRMIGQAPFAGYSVVDFSPESPEIDVTFDGSLLEGAGERPVRYVAICGDRDVVLDAYAVVQVPAAAIGLRAEPSPESSADDSARAREQQEALDAANDHAEELERELEEVRGRLERARQDLDATREREQDARARRRELETRLGQLEAELAASSGVEALDSEYARLETALHERGQELTELRAEVERRGVLVRDLVEEMREQRGVAVAAPVPAVVTPVVAPAAPAPARSDVGSTLQWTPDEMHQVLRAQVSDALERAVGAETEKAELAFRLDEVRGELAIAERRAEAELEEMRRVEAALRGTVRGLNARLAEVTELFQLTQARLALSEDDRNGIEARNTTLQRELAEVREQLELEIARMRVEADARRSEHAADEASATRAESSEELERLRALERDASTREAELRAALEQHRASAAEHAERQTQARGELESARRALAELEERVEGMRFGYESRVAELVSELDLVGSDAERALVQVGELRTRLDVCERNEAALRGQLSGTSLRLADREQAVAALSARLAETEVEPPRRRASDRRDETEERRDDSGARAELESARSEAQSLRVRVDELTAELAAARAEADGHRARLEELGGQLATAQARVEELDRALAAAPDEDHGEEVARLRASVAARDAMVARLQSQIAHASDERSRIEDELEERAELLRARSEELDAAKAVAGVQSDEGVRELEELTARLEQSEGERRAATEALEEAREMLGRLLRELPEIDEEPLGSEDSVVVRRLRERVTLLDAAAADREVLLRSLTAQLQERDDRLRALERLQAGDGTDGGKAELEARLLEMEERVARLTEELENERRLRRGD